ncbi:MAG: DUF2147 domain-containing protein [Spirochaetia bacterium]|nr:DUF2147 domain-containing protein [Spirochaetia bacterium]
MTDFTGFFIGIGMKKIIYVSFIFSLFFSFALQANTFSPVGRWKTVNEKTNKVESIVSIWKDGNGKLRGKIEKIFPEPGEDPNPVCDKCKPEDSRYNKPIIGLEILNGFKPAAPGNSIEWIDGKILDPNDGNIYNCNLTVKNGGKKLEVRGYIGFSWIGRSQIWIRDE